MPKKLRKSPVCLNCGYQIGDSRYCPNCGQQNSDKQVSIKYLLDDFLGDYFTFDSKFFRSFFPLLTKPGFLTKEYNSGKRTNYILPLRLYIFTTFFFFLIITLNDKIKVLDLQQTGSQEVLANQDSLQNFLSEYQPNLSETKRNDIAYNLNTNFDIIYAKNENKKFIQDTIEQVLLKSSPLLKKQSATRLAQEITVNFKFSKKKKENSEKHLERLRLLIKHFPQKLTLAEQNAIISDLDARYKIKKVNRKADNHQILIYGEKADSAKSTFKKFLKTKIQKIVNRGEEGGMFFLSEMLNHVPKVMFLLLPIFALLLKLFYIRHKIVYINHLIFALHLHTIFFIYILIPIIFTNGYVFLAMMLMLWFHLFFSFKNVYGQSSVKTFFKMNTIMFIYTFVIFAGVLLLLFLTLLSI